MIREDTLRKKGWSEEEIAKAMKILAKKRDVFFTDKIAAYIYWFSLLMTIAGSFFASVMLIPFLLLLKSVLSLSIIVFIAAVFGALINILLNDIELADYKHHVIMSIFLPIFVAINTFVIVSVATHFSRLLPQNYSYQSPILISLLYAAGFVIPIIIDKVSKVARRGHTFPAQPL